MKIVFEYEGYLLTDLTLNVQSYNFDDISTSILQQFDPALQLNLIMITD